MRVFYTHNNLFGIPEEHISRTYCLPSHVIFHLLQEIKDDFEPSTRSHAIPGLSKLLATLHFLATGSFQHTMASLFLYSLFATMLICAALGRLYCVGRYVNEMLRLCSFICALLNHLQKFPRPSALFLNCALALICPVKLALDLCPVSVVLPLKYTHTHTHTHTNRTYKYIHIFS